MSSIFVTTPVNQIEYQKIEDQTNIINLNVPSLISYYSNKYGINDEIPLAIAKAESNYKNECNTEKGCIAGIGIFQIVQSTFDEQCENYGSPYNAKDNIACGIKMIANNEFWRWNASKAIWLNEISDTAKEEIETLCSCIKGIRSFGIDVPIGTDAKDLPVNSTLHIGGVLLFTYKDTSHAALIIDLTDDYILVKETNFSRCKKTIRKVSYDDPFIKGVYSN